ncbi:LysR family transcriptional regulator [Archangium violaceum]|uniref:LysR family transcriptional regulator n=1 Tax=Archangium violaceum TaxID=83451 RepID=UPI001950A282|nr:LysR family transcriptional regulator [Archangium violaceum]QRN97617.1 LysR family transcriptional regulator [Archangium violaceum]
MSVARDGSFTAAAAALDMPKSTLSKRITALEERLGVVLFRRTTRAVRLTSTGQLYLQSATRILADLEDAGRALRDLDDSPRGLVRITTPALVGERLVAPALLELLRRAPELSLELVATDRLVNLIDEGFDLAIRAGVLADSSLIARRLRPWNNVLCASRDYVEARGRPRDPVELGDHSCIVFQNCEGGTLWTLEKGRRRVQVPVSGRYAANTQELALGAARAGLGIARLSEFVVEDDLRAGRLVPILPEWVARAGDLHLVYPTRRHLGSGVRAVMEELVNRLAMRPLSE